MKNFSAKAVDPVTWIDAIFVNEGRKRVIGAICTSLGFSFAFLGIVILTTPIDGKE